MEGEHYLSFSTYADLEEQIDKLRQSKAPSAAGRSGREYALLNYSVERWDAKVAVFKKAATEI